MLVLLGQDLQVMIHPLFAGTAGLDEDHLGDFGGKALVQGDSPISRLNKAQREVTLSPPTTMKSSGAGGVA